MESLKIYEKDGNFVKVGSKFIYQSEVYKLWKGGASLIDDKYYSSPKVFKWTKSNTILRKKDYILKRFVDLVFAPETYLVNNGFKLITNETIT